MFQAVSSFREWQEWAVLGAVVSSVVTNKSLLSMTGPGPKSNSLLPHHLQEFLTDIPVSNRDSGWPEKPADRFIYRTELSMLTSSFRKKC
jgi:hypothetical protein